MSAYSTLTISRKKAIEYILSKIFNLDNEDLKSIMDMLLSKSLYDTRVVDSEEEEDDECIY